MKEKIGKLPSIRRLPQYLGILKILSAENRKVVSSSYLARMMNTAQVNVKKDLDMLHISGKTGVGYSVNHLISAIENFLGWHNSTDTFLVGVGHLGYALLGYPGFREHGLNLIAAFDNNIKKTGKQIHGIDVFHTDKIPNLCKRLNVHLAILCVPGDAAQEVTDLLVDSGITGIWNFSNRILEVPENVIVQQAELYSGLAELSFRVNRLFAEKEKNNPQKNGGQS